MLGNHPQREGDVVARSSVVGLLVPFQVGDDGLVHLLLLVPFHPDTVEVGRLVSSHVQNLGFDILAPLHAHYHEGQAHLFVVVCRQGEIVLTEEHFACFHFEVEAVGVGTLFVAHEEGDDALLWRVAVVGCSHPDRLPIALHASVAHLHVAIARLNLNHLRQNHIGHVACFGLSYNLGKHLLGVFACEERVAKVLVDEHLTLVWVFRVFLALFFSFFPFALGQSVAQ